ncbi:hypothetical protein ACHAXS_002687 [Conticribra weissflogii]
MRKGMNRLPLAGTLANQLLEKRFTKYGCYKFCYAPGLWKHNSKPIQFALFVDDFGIKYFHKKDADHLQNALKDHFKMKIDWSGEFYFGITFGWHYKDR